VAEVVPPSTVTEYYHLPRTRAQSCYLVRSFRLSIFVSCDVKRFQMREPDHELEAEEGRPTEIRRTASPDSHHDIPEMDVSKQPSVESNVSGFTFAVC
jgi:hypothetical protein